MYFDQSFLSSTSRHLQTSLARPALKLLIAGLLIASGCAASADNAIEVSLDENFQLRIGQSARIESEDLEIGMQAVTADSRCGKDEVCITEGDAIVRIWLQIAGQAKEEHELHTGSRMPNAVDYANMGIGLVALHPAALSGRVIEPADYVATLRVVRGMSGGKVVY